MQNVLLFLVSLLYVSGSYAVPASVPAHMESLHSIAHTLESSMSFTIRALADLKSSRNDSDYRYIPEKLKILARAATQSAEIIFKAKNPAEPNFTKLSSNLVKYAENAKNDADNDNSIQTVSHKIAKFQSGIELISLLTMCATYLNREYSKCAAENVYCKLFATFSSEIAQTGRLFSQSCHSSNIINIFENVLQPVEQKAKDLVAMIYLMMDKKFDAFGILERLAQQE